MQTVLSNLPSLPLSSVCWACTGRVEVWSLQIFWMVSAVISSAFLLLNTRIRCVKTFFLYLPGTNAYKHALLYLTPFFIKRTDFLNHVCLLCLFDAVLHLMWEQMWLRKRFNYDLVSSLNFPSHNLQILTYANPK